jgi:RNA polymerase sigma-70 factor, ECF subfamily
VAASDSDESLMRRFQAGDASAFEALLGRHRAAVFAFLVRMTGDRARAEDLLQETWLRVVSAAPRWERRARFTTWLYTLARNLAVDEARRAAHRVDGPEARRPDDPEPAGPAYERAPGDGPEPDRAAESARLRPAITAALLALPPEQREVFLLREYAGVPFDEIAKVTGAAVGTVKSRMRYALEGLRKSLAERGVGPELARPDAPRSAAP